MTIGNHEHVFLPVERLHLYLSPEDVKRLELPRRKNVRWWQGDSCALPDCTALEVHPAIDDLVMPPNLPGTVIVDAALLSRLP